jgi:uncharacterized protein (TIGR03435 family)
MRKRLMWHRHVISLGSAAICMGLLVAIPHLQAQAPAVTPTVDGKVPSYDVVSIKPDHTDNGHISIRIDDGNFDALNVTLKTLILGAYNLKEAQLFGLPKWGDSAHFDIKAKIINPDKKQLEALTPEEFQSMQQPILANRFQLKFHRERKILPVYELVTIKGGPKFREITPIEQKSDAGVNGVRAGGISVHNRNLVATGIPISRLADQLSAQLQRVVVDKTGLAGNYNFQLSWSPDDAGPPSPDVAAPPDIFTALEEQLGLKLQPGKEEMDTFVIDHVEYPSEN